MDCSSYLKPRIEFIEDRMLEIVKATIKVNDLGYTPPDEWHKEYDELADWVARYNNERSEPSGT